MGKEYKIIVFGQPGLIEDMQTAVDFVRGCRSLLQLLYQWVIHDLPLSYEQSMKAAQDLFDIPPRNPLVRHIKLDQHMDNILDECVVITDNRGHIPVRRYDHEIRM